MGGCQNYGPFLGTLNIRCRMIIGMRATHMKRQTPQTLLGPKTILFKAFGLF